MFGNHRFMKSSLERRINQLQAQFPIQTRR
jgi:hypothetical protein